MAIPIRLRYQQVSDAKRFVEILNNPNFLYFPARPKSIEEGKRLLRQSIQARKKKTLLKYSIIYLDKVVGSIGLVVDRRRPYIGEIGYFVDESYWNKGIATNAILLLEQIALTSMGIKRIEILIVKKNISSQRVAIKAGYKKEGIAKKKLLLFSEYVDCYVYAKVLT